MRPMNLNLWRMRFPPMAIASILHRISGVIIFLCLPLLLYVLHYSLISQEDFNSIAIFVGRPWVKVLLWLALSAAIYHLLAGVRHLVMDIGIAESLVAGRITAYIVIILGIIAAVFCGGWLWHV